MYELQCCAGWGGSPFMCWESFAGREMFCALLHLEMLLFLECFLLEVVRDSQGGLVDIYVFVAAYATFPCT
jgi:hypothetical protein